MIKTIIFDIGNVLADFNFEGCFRNYAKDEAIYQKMVQATVQSQVWNEFDRGEWSDEKILNGFIKNVPSIENELREMFSEIKDIVIQRDYAIPWIKELKQNGYQVLVLSNFPRRIYELHKEKELQFLEYVDGGILSYRERLIKPDHRIYQLLMERYALDAKECLFFDDRVENINAAKEIGWKGIVFTTKDEAIKKMKMIICDQ